MITEDQTWYDIQKDAEEEIKKEPILASYLHSTIINHNSLERALAYHLAHKLGQTQFPPIMLMELIDEAFETWKGEYEQLDDVCVIGVRV